MCGCSGGSSVVMGASGSFCRSQMDKLQKSRNKLAILFNHIKDVELRAKFKEDRDEIELIMREASETGTCPDHETAVYIENEVNNEYAKYYNT